MDIDRESHVELVTPVQVWYTFSGCSHHYRQRSEGDNVLGNVCSSVRLFVGHCSHGFAEGSKEQRIVIINPRYLSVCRII